MKYIRDLYRNTVFLCRGLWHAFLLLLGVRYGTLTRAGGGGILFTGVPCAYANADDRVNIPPGAVFFATFVPGPRRDGGAS